MLGGGARTNNLDLDVHLDEALAEGVDLDQSGVDGAVEAAEFRDQTDVTLRDVLVGVRADDAAGDCTEGANAGPEGVDWWVLACGLMLLHLPFLPFSMDILPSPLAFVSVLLRPMFWFIPTSSPNSCPQLSL